MRKASMGFSGVEMHGRGVCVGRCRGPKNAEVSVDLAVLSVVDSPTRSVAKVECETCRARWTRIVCRVAA